MPAGLTRREDELPLVQAVLCQQPGDQVPLRNVHLHANRCRMGGEQVCAGGVTCWHQATTKLSFHPPQADEQLSAANQLPAHLLIQGVSPQLHHLQSIQQGRRDVCPAVGGGHKERGGEVKGQAQVGIDKSSILLGVEHLKTEQNRAKEGGEGGRGREKEGEVKGQANTHNCAPCPKSASRGSVCSSTAGGAPPASQRASE